MSEEIIKDCEKQLAELKKIVDQGQYSKQCDNYVTNLKVKIGTYLLVVGYQTTLHSSFQIAAQSQGICH